MVNQKHGLKPEFYQRVSLLHPQVSVRLSLFGHLSFSLLILSALLCSSLSFAQKAFLDEKTPDWAAASPQGCNVKTAKELTFARVRELNIQILEVLYVADDEKKAEIAAQELAQFLLAQGVMVRVLKKEEPATQPKSTFARIEIKKEMNVLLYMLVEKSGKRNAPWKQSCAATSPPKETFKKTFVSTDFENQKQDPAQFAPQDVSPSAPQDVSPSANLKQESADKSEASFVELDESFDGSSIRSSQAARAAQEASDEENKSTGPLGAGAPFSSEKEAITDAHLLKAIDHYLDQMLWIDEMHMAALSGDMVSHIAIFVGRDRKEISLKEAILIADDEELRNRYADIVAAWNGQQMMMWTFMGSGALVSSVGLGILLTPAFVSEIPKEPWMLIGGLTMTSGLLVALGGSFFVPEILLPAEEQIQDHDVRRMVREHNERLRKELKLNLQRDRLPSGFPGNVR